MKETLIDIETYSEVDIGKCGLYRYAADTSFEILLVAWATDEGDGFGETRCADRMNCWRHFKPAMCG